MQTPFFSSTSRLLTALVCAGALAGCAQSTTVPSGTQWQAAADNTTYLSPELQQFFNNSAEQASAYFDQTPWGNHADVIVQRQYYAGSGRECLGLQVLPAAQAAKTAIACQQNNQWVPVRPVTELLSAQ
ncbi:DVU3141 family protein [Marinobacterium sp. YM272]|uniref:DVU3141 family protein n=1 Tax=Marinobacterium sp. YM272 TaxID=3421654 RepID=UPI003D7F4175